MTKLLTILFNLETDSDDVPDEQEIQKWAKAAYLSTKPAQLSVKIVGEEESQALNLKYRQKNCATNVLSFPLDAPMESGEILLGDLAICASIVSHEAGQQGKFLLPHWAHMVVHGMLHLQGYDHQLEEQAAEMEKIERKIMLELGYPDPYLIN